VTIIQEAQLSKRRNNRATQEVSHYTTPLTHNRNHHRALPEHLTLVNDNFHQRRRIELIPKSLNQETYIDLLTDPEKLIIFATGPAGTGKTMLAVMAAIKALKEGECKKIVLTRPAVGVDDEKHGFLPGDLNAKMEPWCIPLFDVINEYYNTREVAKMLEEKTIEIAPLAFLRGRNLKNAFIICDEMQNATVNQMKMVLTRLAENSKMVITGDLKQMDRKYCTDNGLQDFIARLQSAGSNRIATVDFARKDVQRHPVVSEVLKLYGED
jgi:phosphate starvation-inducible PhoH-like protein